VRKLLAVGDVYVEISMLEGVGGIAGLLEQLPRERERVLFGSHAPFFYFEAAELKLEESPLAPELRRAIGPRERRAPARLTRFTSPGRSSPARRGEAAPRRRRRRISIAGPFGRPRRSTGWARFQGNSGASRTVHGPPAPESSHSLRSVPGPSGFAPNAVTCTPLRESESPSSLAGSGPPFAPLVAPTIGDRASRLGVIRDDSGSKRSNAQSLTRALSLL